MKEEINTPADNGIVDKQDEPLSAGQAEHNIIIDEPRPAISHTLSTDTTTDGLEAFHDFEAESLVLPLSGADKETPKSVTPKRKEALLLEARNDRLHWIQEAPLPYRKEKDPEDPWDNIDALYLLRHCHAVSEVPSAIRALEFLYNFSSSKDESVVSVAQRIQSLLNQQDANLALPSGLEVLARELVAREDDSVVMAYHNFLSHLQDPSCAMLVQGMRRFCRIIKNYKDMASLAKQFTSYLETTYKSIQIHLAWKGEDLEQLQVRRSLESCIYAHCFLHTESVIWDGEAQKAEDAFVTKLNSLQFITPKHLEIACLGDESADVASELDDLLKGPIAALQAIDLYYSPYEKLDRVLAIYRDVNAALSKALNRQKSSHDGSLPLKLPSADDVLPTMILVILKAKPKRLLVNLKVVEEWSPPEFIRGEAGYAYTNLYGAVQFLQEIDLEKEPKNLNIGSDDLKKGIESCRKAAKEMLEAKDAEPGKSASLLSNPSNLPRLTPNDVHIARRKGESLDLEWALRFLGQQESNTGAAAAALESKSRSAFDEASEGLPSNFSRKYSFLTACPENIKMSEVSVLLEEYRVLVQTVERLIGARTASIKAARKATAVAAEKDLLARVRELDPTLLPSTEKSRNESF